MTMPSTAMPNIAPLNLMPGSKPVGMPSSPSSVVGIGKYTVYPIVITPELNSLSVF